MVLHVFLCVWRIRDHVGGDLTAPIEHNLLSAITVQLLLIPAASLQPALPSRPLSRCGALFSVPGGTSPRCPGIPRPVPPRAAGGREGRTEGREAAATAGFSPSAWHARARAEPQGRSRPAPSPAALTRPDWRGAVPITGRGARRSLALRGRAAPASARADPAPAVPLSAVAPLLAALSCLPPRAAGASSCGRSGGGGGSCSPAIPGARQVGAEPPPRRSCRISPRRGAGPELCPPRRPRTLPHTLAPTLLLVFPDPSS